MEVAELIEPAAKEYPDIYGTLEPAAEKALQVAAVIHQSTNWDTWNDLALYWECLRKRIKQAHIGGPTLKEWTSHIIFAMDLNPSAENRVLLDQIASKDDNKKILNELTKNTEWIISLLRVCVDIKDTQKTSIEEGYRTDVFGVRSVSEHVGSVAQP